jgi:transcriptional regulator with XRE-family HTH domain
MPRIIDAKASNMTGPQIKKARRKAGLSQQQLSAKLETMAVYVCRGSISRIEHGQRTVTDIEIDAISKILNMPLDTLFNKS